MSLDSNSWLIQRNPSAEPRARLFCLPYGGGAARIYDSWPAKLPTWLDVCAVQPPGRATRYHELPFRSVSELVRAASKALKPFLNLPFGFFGHSLGALVSFELARHLRSHYAFETSLLLVSGCRAPQIPYTGSCHYDLPEADFLTEIFRLNGTPKELREHPEVMEFMLPLLRADFAMDQTYCYKEAELLNCPIVAFGGLQDEIVSVGSLQAWELRTTDVFAAKFFPGDHFFIHSAHDLLLDAVSSSVREYLIF